MEGLNITKGSSIKSKRHSNHNRSSKDNSTIKSKKRKVDKLMEISHNLSQTKDNDDLRFVMQSRLSIQEDAKSRVNLALG